MSNKCVKCNFSWFPRTEKKSAQCPKCRTTNWDGNSTKYNFKVIEIGHSRLYDWPEPLENRPRLFAALNSYSRRSGREFYCYPESKGILIKRIS